MSTEAEFAAALFGAFRDLRDPARFELLMGSGYHVVVMADGDFNEKTLATHAPQLAEMAVAKMAMRRQAETCEHDWSEPLASPFENYPPDSICLHGCGTRKSEVPA